MDDYETNVNSPAERVLNPKLITDPRSDSPLVDGPCHPFSWRQDGKTIGKMRTGSWKLVKHLWQQLDRAATFSDLLQPVYDDPEHIADASAFGSLCKAATKFFKEHGIPWRAGTKKTVVFLEPAPEFSAQKAKDRVLPAFCRPQSVQLDLKSQTRNWSSSHVIDD